MRRQIRTDDDSTAATLSEINKEQASFDEMMEEDRIGPRPRISA
jgi:hypothetical protein